MFTGSLQAWRAGSLEGRNRNVRVSGSRCEYCSAAQEQAAESSRERDRSHSPTSNFSLGISPNISGEYSASTRVAGSW